MKRKKKYYLILSSSSKARKNLLEQIKIPHTSFCPKVNENPLKNEKPKDLVKRLSILKVKEAKKDHKNCFILAADTVVYARKQFINKTLKRDIAYNNIKLLSGRRHTVYTGLAFMQLNGDIKYYLSTTKVKFKLLSEKDILEYLKSNEWKNKAGSYAIQGSAAKFIDFISGSYSGIVGLPLEKVYTILKDNMLN